MHLIHKPTNAVYKLTSPDDPSEVQARGVILHLIFGELYAVVKDTLGEDKDQFEVKQGGVAHFTVDGNTTSHPLLGSITFGNPHTFYCKIYFLESGQVEVKYNPYNSHTPETGLSFDVPSIVATEQKITDLAKELIQDENKLLDMLSQAQVLSQWVDYFPISKIVEMHKKKQFGDAFYRHWEVCE